MTSLSVLFISTRFFLETSARLKGDTSILCTRVMPLISYGKLIDYGCRRKSIKPATNFSQAPVGHLLTEVEFG